MYNGFCPVGIAVQSKTRQTESSASEPTMHKHMRAKNDSKAATITFSVSHGRAGRFYEKKCNLTLAMSPTCHSNNSLLICSNEFFLECIK